ncbi:hypothetical protein DTO280E4_4467 [Paecilomyces variotii]|nr:hypothetical protein DTO280E4_4467 [Paecilomyces variotii]KAJ9371048.1 hypothetical protein DTO282E5_4345 [Paecilomyces variotii]
MWGERERPGQALGAAFVVRRSGRTSRAQANSLSGGDLTRLERPAVPPVGQRIQEKKERLLCSALLCSAQIVRHRPSKHSPRRHTPPRAIVKLSRQKRDSRTRCERHTTDAVTLHDASPRGHQKRLEASYQAGCETAELAPSAIGVRDHGLASSSVEHASQAWVAPKIFQPGLDELPIELLSCPVIAVCSRILSRKVGGYHRQFPSTSQCQTVKSALGSFSLSLFFFPDVFYGPSGPTRLSAPQGTRPSRSLY